jgi:hypothetical protein
MGERPAPVPGVDLLFTEDDTVEILDFLADENLTCIGCGQPKAESFDPANEWAYRAHVLACHACATKRRAEKRLDDVDGVYSFAELKT